MTGEGRLDRNGCRLRVTHLADHDNFRILAEEASQPAREVKLRAGTGLGLADALDDLFDRILDRDDMAAAGLGTDQVAQTGVDGRGLAAAAWAGEQDGPRALLQHRQKRVHEISWKAEL